MSLQKAERKKATIAAIRQIFGKLKTFNGTSTRKRRTYEQQKRIKQMEGQRYWARIRQYKAIMKTHGWLETAPNVIPDSLRALTPTSLQINSLPLPEPLTATARSDFVFVPPEIHHDFITEAEANHIMAAEVQLYAFRASVLKRAPKVEWFRHRPLTYSWGQHRSNSKYAKIFPDWIEKLAQRLPEPVNHAIVIRYHDGMKTYAPWHSDKCQELGRRTGCMKRGTSFYVISVGDPRTFELGDETAVLWENALPHRSMICIDAKTNANVKHQVPQDKHWHGCRWSLIFRTIVE